MSTSHTPYSAGSPSGTAPAGWGRVGVRMFLVVVPSLLVGFVLATVLLPASLLAAHSGLGWLIDVPAGVLAGVGLGFLVPPTRERMTVQLGVAAAMTAVVLLALVGLAQLRVPSSSGLDVAALVLGVVVTVVVQSVLAAVLWRSRAGR